MRQLISLAALLMLSSAAAAEVTDSAENGFTTAHEVIINAPRTRTWQAAVDEIGKWWSDDHTVNGDAGRMSINSVPQGCFCETFENGGGVVHMNVTFVNPGIILRLTGGLGPLGLLVLTHPLHDRRRGVARRRVACRALGKVVRQRLHAELRGRPARAVR